MSKNQNTARAVIQRNPISKNQTKPSKQPNNKNTNIINRVPRQAVHQRRRFPYAQDSLGPFYKEHTDTRVHSAFNKGKGQAEEKWKRLKGTEKETKSSFSGSWRVLGKEGKHHTHERKTVFGAG